MGTYKEKQANGDLRWRIDLTWKSATGERRRVRQWAQVNTRNGAEKEERRIIAALNDGSYQLKATPKAPALKEMVPAYFKWAEPRRKPSYLFSQRERLKKWVLPALGERAVDTITVADKDQLTTQLLAKGKKPSTVNNVLGALQGVLIYCHELGCFSALPPARYIPRRPEEARFLDESEYRQLLTIAAKTHLYGAFVVAGEAGLRFGEIRGLRWEDVDFEKGVLHVQRSLWQEHLTLPKHNKTRSIPMSSRLNEVLQAQQHQRGPFVFCNRKGQSFARFEYVKTLGMVCRLSKVSIHWHGLRHTFCSRLVARGVDLRAVMELAGHASIVTTQRYLHVTPSHLRGAIEKLNQ